jgi:hypothetical protein
VSRLGDNHGVSTREATSRRQPCAVHGDRQAVETCAACGRLVCLDCAIPFRGRVLCAEDAARELGDPSPPPAQPDRRPRRLELAGAALLGAAVLATVPPWDNFGSLTGVLSAWRPEPEIWPLIASAGALVGAVLAAWLAFRVRAPGTAWTAAWAGAALLSTLASARVIFGAPDFVDHTAAPYVTLAGSAAGAVLGALRLRTVSTRP